MIDRSYGVLLASLVDWLVVLVSRSVTGSWNLLDNRSVGVLLDVGWDGVSDLLCVSRAVGWLVG
jgi:hypothetical protein